MIELIDEFGARIFIPINTIKYFKDNVGGIGEAVHKSAITILENVYGDLFYLSETVEEIFDKLFGGKENEQNA